MGGFNKGAPIKIKIKLGKKVKNVTTPAPVKAETNRASWPNTCDEPTECNDHDERARGRSSPGPPIDHLSRSEPQVLFYRALKDVGQDRVSPPKVNRAALVKTTPSGSAALFHPYEYDWIPIANSHIAIPAAAVRNSRFRLKTA